MKVEEINKKYQDAKKDKLYANLNKLEKHQQDLEKQVKTQKRKYEDAQTKKARAEEDKDDAKIKQAEQEIKEVEEKKQKATNFKELLTKHPNVETNIVGMIHAIDDGKVYMKEQETIEQQLTFEKDPAKIAKLNSVLDNVKSDIAKARTKFETNRSLILKCAEKSNIDISKDWLSEFVKYGSKAIAKDKNGKLDINKTLNKKIKSYDKEMKPYKTMINNLEKVQQHEEITRPTQTGNQEEITAVPETEEPIMRDHVQDGLDEGGAPYTNPLPDTIRKPKFFEYFKHPFKSIKALNDYRKAQKSIKSNEAFNEYRQMQSQTEQNAEQPVQGAQEGEVNQGENTPEPNAPAVENQEQTAEERNKQNREFRKALHYDIVQDYINKREEDLKKEDFRETENTEEQENEQDDETR